MSQLLRYSHLFKPLFFALALLWAYWPILGEMASRWSDDPQYSHGYLVPVFSLALLWMRRRQVDFGRLRGSWWGIPLLGIGAAVHLAGAYFYVAWVEAISLLATLGGVCVCLGGWKALRWSGPSIGFLFFMLPLPFRLEGTLAYPLQRFATKASTYLLQTAGFPALAEGTVILMEDVRLGVVEACSGLSMLVTFFALATAVALVLPRSWLDKLLIVSSAIPIAILVNVVRITATGILHRTVGTEVADAVFHDLAGWLMMPMALILLWLELKILNRLLVAAEKSGAMPLDFSGPALASPARRGPAWTRRAGPSVRGPALGTAAAGP